MATGFGAEGTRYAARLPADLPVIATGLDGCVAALAAAVTARRAGQPFYVAPLIDDPRALVAQRVAGQWMEALTGIDDRYDAFDALASGASLIPGVTDVVTELDVIDERERRVLRDVAIMGDALLVRSAREADRVARVLKRHRPTVVVAPGTDPSVPQERSVRGDTIVVWAPYLRADQIGVIAMGLEYLRCPVVYMCASGSLRNVRGAFLEPARAMEALASAACVIDAAIGDPAGAIALAGLGVPLIVASTSGASEFLDGVLEYTPWDWRTVFAAAAAASGFRPPCVSREALPVAALSSALEGAASPASAAGPLVSVVVLTYNRRALLSLALDSIARQRYANIELIVVNNGGVDVADLLSGFERVRLLTLPENLLPNAALELGLATCTGKYFGVTSDDDEYFPDHFARLVDALERSGAQVAHSNCVTRYISVRGGERETIAFRVRADRPSDPLQILVGATMSFHSMLFRTDIRAALGGMQTDIAPSDLEYTIRAAQHYDFVHVDNVSCEWNYVVEGTSYTHTDAFAEDLKLIYDKYPTNGSRIVERRRINEIERFGARHAGKALWPADLLLTGQAPIS